MIHILEYLLEEGSVLLNIPSLLPEKLHWPGQDQDSKSCTDDGSIALLLVKSRLILSSAYRSLCSLCKS